MEQCALDRGRASHLGWGRTLLVWILMGWSRAKQTGLPREVNVTTHRLRAVRWEWKGYEETKTVSTGGMRGSLETPKPTCTLQVQAPDPERVWQCKGDGTGQHPLGFPKSQVKAGP